MSRRIDRINKHLQRTFGEVLQRDVDLPPDVLVTISRVDTVPNLKSAEIWLYIQPIDQSEKVLAQLESQLYDLQGSLNRKLDLSPLPRIRLRIDYGAEHSDQIETTIRQLKQPDDES